MRKLSLFVLISLFFGACEGKKGSFIETIISDNTHQVSVDKLIKSIKAQDLTLFHNIDHQANAQTVKMNLKPKTVIVFGNPKMGTVLMNCNASMGLDLPLRILVSTDYEGITSLSYTNPEYWSLKHNIKDKNCLSILNKAKIALRTLADKAGEK
jgi:uncharacterized protein (DUF302 family)